MATQSEPDFDKQLAALVGQEVIVYPNYGYTQQVVGILEEMAKDIYVVGDEIMLGPGDVETINDGIISMIPPYDGNQSSYDD